MSVKEVKEGQQRRVVYDARITEAVDVRHFAAGDRPVIVFAAVQLSALNQMSVIRTENLCKSYGLRRGVSGINLALESGEVFGFLGPNGAGKSTTIRMLLGFLQPTEGSAAIFGMNCWRESATIKQDVGYVAGDVRLYPWLTATRAFRIVGEIRHRDIRQRGYELAERFRLEPDLPVRKMSRGNRQKLALVLALAHRPRLVVLDEPTSGLDPLMQDTLAACLREMAADGHSVFFSSHTLSEVETLCDRVAIVRNGQIVADERLQALKDRAPRTVVLTFVSESEAQACQPPDVAQSFEVKGREVHISLVGSAMPISRWAAALPIADIQIGPPSLDTLFRGYYDEGDQQAESDA